MACIYNAETLISGYVETDPNSRLTVTTCQIDFAAIDRNETAHHINDFTAAYFDGDFTHRLEAEITSFPTGNSGMACLWGLSNAIDTPNNLADVIYLRVNGNAGTPIFQLVERDGGVEQTDDSVTFTPGTTYWAEPIRVDSTNTLTCKIYTDSNFSTLFDTLTLTLTGTAVDWRYYYAFSAINDATSSQTITGYTANHDLVGTFVVDAEMPAWAGEIFMDSVASNVSNVRVLMAQYRQI